MSPADRVERPLWARPKTLADDDDASPQHPAAHTRSVNATEPQRRVQAPGYNLVMILERLDIDVPTFEAATGWAIKPEGACKGDVCVPLQGEFDVLSVADRLGMAVVHDETLGLWALGPESVGGRALVTAVAPELVLDDLDGNEFGLSSLRGQKVVLVAWAPY